MASDGNGPVVFAYDGSDLAKAAIAEAGRQLRPSRPALVLTVWQPYNVGFTPPRELKMDAAAVDEVRAAAEANRRSRSIAGQGGRIRRPEHGRKRLRPPGRASWRPLTSRTRALWCSAPTVAVGSPTY